MFDLKFVVNNTVALSVISDRLHYLCADSIQ